MKSASLSNRPAAPADNLKKRWQVVAPTLILSAGVAAIVLAVLILPGLVRNNSFELPLLDATYPATNLYPTQDDNPTVKYRWTGQTATIELPENLVTRRITLQVSAYRPTNSPQPNLSLYYADQLLGTFAIGRDFQSVAVTLPRGFEFTPGDLRLTVDNTIAPTKADNRELGVALSRLAMEAGRFPPFGLIVVGLAQGLFVVLLGRLVVGWSVARAAVVALGASLPLVIYWNVWPIEGGGFGLGVLVLLISVGVLLIANQSKIFAIPQMRLGSPKYMTTGGFFFPPHMPVVASSSLVGRVGPLVLLAYLLNDQYNRVLSYQFFWDDYHNARPWTLAQVLSTYVGSWEPLGLEPAYFRPITATSFALNFGLASYEPFGYHLFNLLVQVVVMFLGYVTLRRLRLGMIGSILAILFFAWLPINVGTIAWISQRSHSLALLGVLGAVYCYLRYRDKFNWRWLAAALAATLWAFGSNEIAVVLPALILLLAVSLGLRRKRAEIVGLAAFWLMLAFYLVWRQVAVGSGSGWPGLETVWRGYTQAVYTTLYGFDRLLPAEAAAPLTVTLLLLFGGFAMLNLLKPDLDMSGRWRMLFWGIGWVLMGCLPLALLATSYNVTSRVVYVPSFGYAITVAAGLSLAFSFVQGSVGAWRFIPAAVTLIVLIILVAAPLRDTNTRALRDYAPDSFNVLRYDRYVYDNWKGKIPDRYYQLVERKLKGN